MALDYELMMSRELPDRRFAWGDREVMLYNIGIGFGTDPMDRDELPFVYEKALRVMPTMATVLAWDDRWFHDSGIQKMMTVHGEQRIRLHRALPPAGEVLSSPRVKAIQDKGEGRGAVILVENLLRDAASGEALVTLTSTVFARGDGGFGGPNEPGPAPHKVPEGEPETTETIPTRPDQAVIYRLSGDRNPLHCDPDFSAGAGFPRPILHGLCTYGVACRAVVRRYCDNDPTAVDGFDVRFSSPVFPGETIRTEMWRDGKTVSFRSRVVERDVVVLNNGRATLR
ncbi:MaoC/PaaZ C-terminal domain-containing protein [Oceanibacterium hippocampi]|uniref:MaoC like domain protein n=1 Tax=Oceanibacterium hippocampi TaxID=745714 RepID=A0A1Y5S218_9PROT|nr:MaoC/PaaZ C-terminal domain-containing protein [Oceanibacterium hippocampi]SLN29499.1 MaoC like domain protein [Oceanibacterium hippocampi]